MLCKFVKRSNNPVGMMLILLLLRSKVVVLAQQPAQVTALLVSQHEEAELHQGDVDGDGVGDSDVAVAFLVVVTLLLGLPGELLPLGDMDGVGDTDGVIDGDSDSVPLPLVEADGEGDDILGEFVTDGVTDSDRVVENEVDDVTEAVEVAVIIGEGDDPCGATQLTVLMRLLKMSATYRVPAVSTAMSAVPLKDDVVPMPSLLPNELLPATIDMLLFATSTR